MKKAWIIIGIVILTFLAGIFVYYSQHTSLQEEIAVSSVYEDKTKGSALIIRDETAYDIPQNLYAYVEDGSRVANGEKIAALYSDKTNRSLIDNLNAIEEQIKQTDITVSTVDKTDKVAVESAIKENAERLEALITNHDLADMQTIKGEMNALGSNAEQAQAEEVDRLTTLKTERDKISNQISSTYTPVYAEKSGVFVATTDGYESQLTPDMMASLTPKELDKWLKETKKITKNSKQYKLVDNYLWYVAVEVPEDDVKKLKEGAGVSLRFSDVDDSTVDASVVRISAPQEGKVVVVCSSSGYISGLYHLRQTKVEIVKHSYKGYQVNKNAIRMIDGKTGVFINSGGIAKFKEAQILINTEDVAIIKEDSGNKDALSLYDKVIVGGKNIYDGKLLN